MEVRINKDDSADIFLRDGKDILDFYHSSGMFQGCFTREQLERLHTQIQFALIDRDKTKEG